MPTPKKASTVIKRKAVSAAAEKTISTEEARSIEVGALKAEIDHQKEVARLTAELNAYDASIDAYTAAAVMLTRLDDYTINEMTKTFAISNDAS